MMAQRILPGLVVRGGAWRRSMKMLLSVFVCLSALSLGWVDGGKWVGKSLQRTLMPMFP